jgi:hypothetical protein
MKPELVNATGQDRIATWEEVRHATLATPDCLMEYCYDDGAYCAVDSERGGVIRYPAEEFEFFALLSEDDATVN